MNKPPYKVFIVDDSAVMRQVLGEVIAADKDLALIGVAPDPILALRKMNKQWPDVILLDIAMPKMDGISFLKQIMSTHPTPTVICSSKTEEKVELSLEALSSGAIEVINKPQSSLSEFLHSQEVHKILKALKRAATVKVKPLKYLSEETYRETKSADVMLKAASSKVLSNEKVIVIGASTGGTEAILQFLIETPMNSPPIVIVQHMPPKFTLAFAQRLNHETRHQVVEAEDGMRLMPGVVYIAKGGVHLMITSHSGHYYLELKDGPLVSRHKPSVDVLFRSAAQAAGYNAVGVILTGMGSDGAQGMAEMHQAGSVTLAQDEDSSLVFGMPKEAIAKGGVKGVFSLHALPYQVQKALVDK
ncbi:protein-glutamate methylesterase/protein-glutamine glutaminase [Vibrio genomosp. F10]|uniref:Protein-glutamate methylesterase/protein-glutamine glutaminase n=2 Tax=Vibrio genomosp. F10 TaxID=723171 RepID=A0A1B9QT08_9VIBR|nr:chemotaxis response regulator protein-glutamate methylesterase [Vibrio genomosp. F10]OCH69000.1 chemotaxis response regulator protein-glutamate methylesterase [Vibrio genomosp. F10]